MTETKLTELEARVEALEAGTTLRTDINTLLRLADATDDRLVALEAKQAAHHKYGFIDEKWLAEKLAKYDDTMVGGTPRKSSLAETVEKARAEVATWPESVKAATEFRYDAVQREAAPRKTLGEIAFNKWHEYANGDAVARAVAEAIIERHLARVLHR